MKDKCLKKLSRNKLSLLVMLVAMIFIIMLISLAIAGGVTIFLIIRNIIPSTPVNKHIVVIIYMMLVSLITGTILARIGGVRFLRQINELAEATKEVAAGNFDVRMKTGLSKELNPISNCFNNMAKELSNIETLRTDFVINISHEFKTPIASIRGFARRLKKGAVTDEQREEYLDIIISESERLSRLSRNVLLMSSLESTDKVTEKNDYSLDEQVRRTVLLLEPQLLKKQINVDIITDAVRIVADEEMLSHLWINIIDNAIKFSPDDSKINITLECTGEKAVVIVKDQGIGMDDDMKKRIFDKFYQGDQSRATEGNGLGLSLAKRILELENGHIEVDSEFGKGTSIKVSLPIGDC